MSAKTRKPNALDRLVTKRDLFKVIAAMNEATRNLESRIEDLEKARDLGEQLCAPGSLCPLCGKTLGDGAHFCSDDAPLIQVVR